MHPSEWPTLKQTTLASLNNDQKVKISEDLFRRIDSLNSDCENLRSESNRREMDLLNKYDECRTKIGAMLNLLALKSNQQKECINKIYIL